MAEEGDPWAAAAVVGETEEGVVIALPNDAWHRTAARRKVPTGAVRLVRSHTVGVLAFEERNVSVEEAIVRVWVALLAADWPFFVEIREVGSEDLELGSLFGTSVAEGFKDYIPFAEDLLAAAEERFVFLT